MKKFRGVMAVAAGIGLAAAAFGCASHSHSSQRTYDYDDEPRAARQNPPPVQSEREIESGDYKMVAPGEMVAPGTTIVDPK